MTIHEKPLCKSNSSKRVYRGPCEMKGCKNEYVSTFAYQKYCGTPECNKKVQIMNNEKHKKRREGKMPPVEKKEKPMIEDKDEHLQVLRNQDWLCRPLRASK